MQIGIHSHGGTPINAVGHEVCSGSDTGTFVAVTIREGEVDCFTLYTHDPAELRKMAEVFISQAEALEMKLTAACASVKD